MKHSSQYACLTVNKFIFVLTYLIVAYKCVSTTSSYKFLYFDPPQIQIGYFTATAASNDTQPSPLQFWNTYTCPFTKINRSGPITSHLIIGIRQTNFYLQKQNLGYSQFIILPQSTLNTVSFLSQIFAYTGSTWNFVTLNYFAFDIQFLTNKQILWQFYSPAVASFSLQLSSSQTKPVIRNSIIFPSFNYKSFISIVILKFQKNNINITPQLKVTANIISLLSYRLDFFVYRMNLVGIGINVLFIDSGMFVNNINKQLIFTEISQLHAKTTTASFMYQLNVNHNVNDNTFWIGLFKLYGNNFNFKTGKYNATSINVIQHYIYGTDTQIHFRGFAVYGYVTGCPFPITYLPTCQPCPLNCQMCSYDPIVHCQKCNINYVSNLNGSICSCVAPMQIVSGICADFVSLGLRTCVGAYIVINGTIICTICDRQKNNIIRNNKCICRDGFEDPQNDSICTQICGDGIVINAACDDGNNINHDGCSQNCTIQKQFSCNTTTVPSKCKSQRVIKYYIDSIMRVQEQNSAIITFKLQNGENLPFPVEQNDFKQFYTYFKFTIIISDNPLLEKQIKNFLSFSMNQNYDIQLKFSYQFTVEGMNSTIFINYQNSQYKNYTQKLQFQLIGKNKPLKIQKNFQTIKTLGTSLLVAAIMSIAGLLIGTLTPKFIGLQCIATLQLIFYSQLLIYDISTWPPGFAFLKYMKLTTGFSEIFSLTDYLTQSSIGKKMFNLQMKKTIIQNFNMNFIILILVLVVGFFASYLRLNKQKLMDQYVRNKRKQHKNNDIVQQAYTKKLNELKPYLKFNQVTFWVSSQLVMWIILPSLSSFSAEFQIQNQYTFSLEIGLFQSFILKARASIFLLTILLVFSVGLSNFSNTLLSYKSLIKIYERPQELQYKKLSFIYLFVMGILIFLFNKINLWGVECSVFVLAIQVVYIFTLLAVDPYKQSLRIHTITLISNQSMYLVFLVGINFINYIENLNEIFVLGLGYFITFYCVFSVILTGFRLYYQIRYGEELQIKIQKQRQRQQLLKNQQKVDILKRKRILFQQLAQQKLSQVQKIRDKNIYLFQNKVKQQQRENLMQWLQKRAWDDRQKQKYYFQRFAQKPVKWIKKNQKQKYKNYKKHKKQNQQEAKKKAQQKYNNQEFKQLVQKLQIQAGQIKSSHQKKLHKHKKRITTDPGYAMRIMNKDRYMFMQEEYQLKN